MLPSRERTFELWAPSSSPWSVWAKPVLFSYLPLGDRSLGALTPFPDVSSWVPRADGTTLLVADLPGVRSVQLGEALALAGFRPVPLFNAVPGPFEYARNSTSARVRPLVEVDSIIDALQQVTLRSGARLSTLRSDAPAAFLLDANRRHGLTPRPGDFDNRSISLPTDFPSATFLRSRGVSRVLVANDSVAAQGQPATDLAHTLLRWQVAGIVIQSCTLSESGEASTGRVIEVTRPSRFGVFWHNALSTLGLRRGPLGGFDGTLPVPSSS